MIHILNYGGGTQTAAMCVLVATGKLPKPDYIICADTGREVDSTWEYLETHMRPLMATVGLDIHIARHTLATVDIYSGNGDLVLPVYTQTGKLPTFCSSEWKARVVQRYLRRVGVEGPITNWIGFSYDERRRIKGEEGRRYPLLDLMLTKEDCKAIILRAGLPLPKKSRCRICPHQSNEEWREVRANPVEWAEAIALDNEIRDNDECGGGVFLHHSRIPLEVADLAADDRKPEVRQCGLGLCFI